MEGLYAEDDPTVTLTEGIDLNDLRDPKTAGVEFEVKDESKDREEDTDVYQVFDPDDVFKNMYQDDFSFDEDEINTFEVLRSKMSDLSGDGGVMKRILRPGAGNVVTPESLVRVQYNLYLEGSDEPFDSTRLRGEVLKFRLGQGVVIIGLEMAVESMKKGERAQFIFTPDYAYGKMGCGVRIPGNSEILAEVELLSFIEQEGVDDFYNMTETERKTVSLEQVLKVCKAHKNDGKDLYENKHYQKAFTRYKKAVDLLEMYNLKNEKEEDEQHKILLKLYLNLSICCLHLCHSGRAINYCKKVLEIEPNNCKALYRYGKALRQVQEFDRARSYYKRAQNLEPHNKEISAALVELENIVKKSKIVEETFCRKMFSTSISDTEAKPSAKTKKKKPELTGINEGFKENVEKVLRSFQNDHSSMEMQFPPTQLTPPELACIFEVALDFGLDVRQFGSGQNLQLKVMKKAPEK